MKQRLSTVTHDSSAKAKRIVANASAVTPGRNVLILWVEDDRSHPRLAYHLSLLADMPIEVFVDAISGEIIRSWNAIKN
jgi:hypothetical protein